MGNSDMTVADLERLLFAYFPATDAESWDAPGLIVGDPQAVVGRVALNLDLTAEAVERAASAGCNVLITHHPAFIGTGPKTFYPNCQPAAGGPGRLVYEAASRGVSCIAMHTNLDRSLACRQRFADMLGWECSSNFEFLMDSSRDLHGSGFGALFDFDQPMALKDVAAHCASVFDTTPRVWGTSAAEVSKLAYLNGSWGQAEVYDVCVANDIDCIVVGETRYHFCLDARPHLSVIDLGHDKSELGIVKVICDACLGAGVLDKDIVELDCSSKNWWTI